MYCITKERHVETRYHYEKMCQPHPFVVTGSMWPLSRTLCVGVAALKDFELHLQNKREPASAKQRETHAYHTAPKGTPICTRARRPSPALPPR